MERKSTSATQRLVVIAFLIALEIVLTRFASITTPYLRIGFGFLPVVIVAIEYGPLWAGTAYAIGDIIGALLFPSGPFFPGFTVSAFLAGLVYGLFLYKHEIRIPRVLLACAVVALVINLGLGTFWLTILLGKSYMVLLPARAVKEIISIPVYTALIMGVGLSVTNIMKTRHSA